jgi:hypothetical protein
MKKILAKKEKNPEEEEQRKENLKKNNQLNKVHDYLVKNGLKEKEAVCIEKRTVYFRSDDFLELILTHASHITPLVEAYFKEKIETKDEAKRLAQL